VGAGGSGSRGEWEQGGVGAGGSGSRGEWEQGGVGARGGGVGAGGQGGTEPILKGMLLEQTSLDQLLFILQTLLPFLPNTLT
jgi:hypothetical protein